MANIWVYRERTSPSRDVYDKSLADQWRKLGCVVTREMPFPETLRHWVWVYRLLAERSG